MVSRPRETEPMASPKKLIILGTGGNSVDILDAVYERNAYAKIPPYECIGFLDDDPETWGASFLGRPVLGGTDTYAEHQPDALVMGIGSNEARQRVVNAGETSVKR